MPRLINRSRSISIAGLALFVVLAMAAIAPAGTPVNGARYSGDVKTTATLTVSFRVSKTGKKIKGLRITPTIPNSCGYGGPVPTETSKPSPIADGKFQATVKLSSGEKAKVHGKFVSHHRERGTIDSTNPASPSCDGTFQYSTKPQ